MGSLDTSAGTHRVAPWRAVQTATLWEPGHLTLMLVAGTQYQLLEAGNLVPSFSLPHQSQPAGPGAAQPAQGPAAVSSSLLVHKMMRLGFLPSFTGMGEYSLSPGTCPYSYFL